MFKKLLLFSIFVLCASFAFAQDANTVLLLHMDDVDLNDSSDSSHVTGLGGGVVRSSNQSKFGGYSAYYDGDAYISIPDSDDWHFGTADFTIDFWVYFTGTQNKNFIGQRYNVHNRWFLGTDGNEQLRFFVDGVLRAHQPLSNTWNPDQWYHVALVRESGVTTIYRDGVELDSVVSGFSMSNLNAPLLVGTDYVGAGSAPHEGYIDEFRISNVARWTENFTPPTEAYGSEEQEVVPEVNNKTFQFFVVVIVALLVGALLLRKK